MIKTTRAKEIKDIFFPESYSIMFHAYLPEEDTYRVFG